jgi:aspartate-semialdehyde dehydrogenase
VPVLRSHAVSATARFSNPVSPDQARNVLSSAPGVRVVDDPSRALYPTPLDASGGDDCLVGRIRADLTSEGALCLWVVGDQIRKGAALNAVQIAELLVEQR